MNLCPQKMSRLLTQQNDPAFPVNTPLSVYAVVVVWDIHMNRRVIAYIWGLYPGSTSICNASSKSLKYIAKMKPQIPNDTLLLIGPNDSLLTNRNAANRTNRCHSHGDGLAGHYRHQILSPRPTTGIQEESCSYLFVTLSTLTIEIELPDAFTVCNHQTGGTRKVTSALMLVSRETWAANSALKWFLRTASL